MTTTFTLEVPYYGTWKLKVEDDKALVNLKALQDLGFEPEVSVEVDTEDEKE